MSIPKKKSRVVSVSDKEYRYVIKTSRIILDKVPTLIVQENCDNPGQPFMLPLERVYIHHNSTNFGIGPGDIVKIIQEVIKAGWDPSKKGAAFVPRNQIEITRDETK